jgi:dGTPase
MPRTRKELEHIERQILAPYAQFSGDSRGREYAEPPPDWRTHYQRDRDRVIHSRAYRRLEGKTQVFLNGSGDHLRTRLTHTMEVAAIARNIASALRLNTDLTETIALAHDLGHSPFGHKGEAVLARAMKGHGGFEHNLHSLRIVEQLEQKYPNFPGLNLTWEVREGLAKHQTTYDRPGRLKGFDAKNSSLEAQVANVADEITYYSHDLDDGLDSGLLSEKKLAANVRIFADAAKFVRKRYGRIAEESRTISSSAPSSTCRFTTWWKTAKNSFKKPASSPPTPSAYMPNRSSPTAPIAANLTRNCANIFTGICITTRSFTNPTCAP